MADPFTWGAAGMAATILGGGVDAIGKISKGNSDSDMYQYKAGMALTNASIAQQNAEFTRTQGEKKQQYAGIQGAQKSGQIVAKQAANGLDTNFGTNVNVQQGQEWANREDQNNIRENSLRKAYGFDVEASSKRQEASMDQRAASNSSKSGMIGAMGSIIGTASSVASKWSQGNTLGIWGDTDKRGIETYGPDFTVTGYSR